MKLQTNGGCTLSIDGTTNKDTLLTRAGYLGSYMDERCPTDRSLFSHLQPLSKNSITRSLTRWVFVKPLIPFCITKARVLHLATPWYAAKFLTLECLKANTQSQEHPDNLRMSKLRRRPGKDSNKVERLRSRDEYGDYYVSSCSIDPKVRNIDHAFISMSDYFDQKGNWKCIHHYHDYPGKTAWHTIFTLV